MAGKIWGALPLIPDPKGQIFRTLDIPGTPTYLVLDSRGTVVYVFVGEIHNTRSFIRELKAHLD